SLPSGTPKACRQIRRTTAPQQCREGKRNMLLSSRLGVVAAAAAALAIASPAIAQKRYDSGASDKEIVFGHTIPYSGPASAYGTIGRAIQAYINKINDEGGINGRKLRMISYDDGYSPPKTVEMVRRLV